MGGERQGGEGRVNDETKQRIKNLCECGADESKAFLAKCVVCGEWTCSECDTCVITEEKYICDICDRDW